MSGLKVIAKIYTDFPEKFGIPRQSALAKGSMGKIVFEPEFSDSDFLDGLEGFSHIWLIWGFSENKNSGFTPKVRPPKLGGNEYRGVFATRSPNRPNPLGLSAVKIIKKDKDGLYIEGADMVSGTPVYDIKPYLPYADSIPYALGGFTEEISGARKDVLYDEAVLEKIPSEKREGLINALSLDPRPGYQNDPDRVYKMSYSGFQIKFTVSENSVQIIGVD